MTPYIKHQDRMICILRSGFFEVFSYIEGRHIKFDTLDACKNLIDKEEKTLNDEKQKLLNDKKFIEETILERLNFIDRPANIDEIVEFIFNDIEDTRDKDKSFTCEDVYIGFRRFLEKDL